MTEQEIKNDENQRNENISKEYANLFVCMDQLKNELAKTSDKDSYKIGYLQARISLLNKKKIAMEKTYFNYFNY